MFFLIKDLCSNDEVQFVRVRAGYNMALYFFVAGNGYIPTSCLKEIMRELDDQLTEAELNGMIEEIDSDGSGTVDFDGKNR